MGRMRSIAAHISSSDIVHGLEPRAALPGPTRSRRPPPIPSMDRCLCARSVRLPFIAMSSSTLPPHLFDYLHYHPKAHHQRLHSYLTISVDPSSGSGPISLGPCYMDAQSIDDPMLIFTVLSALTLPVLRAASLYDFVSVSNHFGYYALCSVRLSGAGAIARAVRR